MRTSAVALLAALLLPGCLSFQASFEDCPDHGMDASGFERKVTFQAANQMGREACLKVFVDGRLVASRPLAATDATRDVHAVPHVIATFPTPEDGILAVSIEENGRRAEERFRVDGDDHVVAWVASAGVRLEKHDRAPQWE